MFRNIESLRLMKEQFLKDTKEIVISITLHPVPYTFVLSHRHYKYPVSIVQRAYKSPLSIHVVLFFSQTYLWSVIPRDSILINQQCKETKSKRKMLHYADKMLQPPTQTQLFWLIYRYTTSLYQSRIFRLLPSYLRDSITGRNRTLKSFIYGLLKRESNCSIWAFVVWNYV